MASPKAGSHEERECAACLGGLVYDGQARAWVECGPCSGSGRAVVFVYARATGSAGQTGRLRECAGCRERFAGRDLHEVHEDHGSLAFFEGDELCGACAVRHGIM
jgi:hypothetical protein